MSSTTMKPKDTTKVVASKLMHENLTGLLGPKTAEWLAKHTKVWKRQVQYRIPRVPDEMADARAVLKALKLHEFKGKKGKGLDRLRNELREQLWDVLEAQKAIEAAAMEALKGKGVPAPIAAPSPTKKPQKPKKAALKLSDVTAQTKPEEKKTSLASLLSDGPKTPSVAQAVLAKIEATDDEGNPTEAVVHITTTTKSGMVVLQPGESVEVASDNKVTITCKPVELTLQGGFSSLAEAAAKTNAVLTKAVEALEALTLLGDYSDDDGDGDGDGDDSDT